MNCFNGKLTLIPIATMCFGVGLVCGQNYPNKPIRIVTAGVGGAGDFAARLIANGISGPLGQPVIVENRPTITAPEIVAKAPPDGYTLLSSGSNVWTGPLLRKMLYDPIKDFSPISMISSAPLTLVVHPSLPVKSVKELIALAKAKPGELNYTSGPIGAEGHIAAELFKSLAGVNIVRVFYKEGQGTALADVISGYVQVSFSSAAVVTPHLKSGRVRALAVSSAEPTALFPGLPTIAASLPGFEAGSKQGVWAPAGTPEAIINRLNQDIVRFLSTGEAKERLLSIGAVATYSSPAQFAATIKSEMARIGKVIKDTGISAE